MRKTLVIYQANAYVRLTDYKPELVKEVLIPFCKRNFYRFQKVPGELFGTTKLEVSHVFARFNTDKTELRFNASMLEPLIKFMTDRGYNKSRIEVNEEKVIPAKKVLHVLRDEAIKPRNEKQEEFVEFMSGPIPLVTNNMSTGEGKEQPVSALVKTPTGWTTMGEVNPGDVITGWDGVSTKVTSVHPQGVKDVYRFTFSDGRTAEAGIDHLWDIYDCGKRPHSRNEVITTKEIINRLGKSQPRLYIPLHKPMNSVTQVLPLDPWVLGAVLGDGGMTGGTCTFTNADQFVVDKLREKLNDSMVVRQKVGGPEYDYLIVPKVNGTTTFNHILEQASVNRVISVNKSIPDIFMNGSIEQRWELVRGLMDTDGSAEVPRKGEGGYPVFNTSSEKLAKQFQELIWSLGGVCKVTSRIPTYTYKNETRSGQRAYRCYIRIADPKRCFSLPRKKDLIPQETQYSEKLKLRIVSVSLDRQEESKCITVDHPDRLYVTNNYVVTHNTFCALYSSLYIGERILITVLPRYIDIWIKAFGEFYKIKPEEILVADIYGVPELHKAILNGADPKIIILPLTKIDMYLKKMKEDPTVPCLDQVFNDLQCGVRIIDEAHESIYSVYMSLLYGNHKKTMALSATLRGDDDFINEIYTQLFPPKSYLRATEYTQYIHCIAYHHRIDMWKYKINTKGFGGYSHVKFEQGILKNKHVFEQYYQMLKGAFWTYYLENLREGQKSMWFFATVDFCEAFEKRLKKDYPELDTVVFTAKMSGKKGNAAAYREHQVVITTPGSCGTGRDIPKLFAVFSPIAVSSSQRNDQMVGRTRPVDKWWPDLDPIFVYFVCRDEPKQLEYDKKRRSLFGRKLKKLDVIDSGSRI